MTEEKLGFARLDHWAEYFGLQRMEVLRAAINGRIGLYFHLDDCFTANLSNPNPGHQLARERLRPAYLQADAATLRSIAAHGEALNVQEAAESEAFEIEVTEAEAVATRVALKVVTDVVEQAPLPEGVVVPEPAGYAAVARAAAEMARIQAMLDRGAPLRQKAGDEVAARAARSLG